MLGDGGDHGEADPEAGAVKPWGHAAPFIADVDLEAVALDAPSDDLDLTGCRRAHIGVDDRVGYGLRDRKRHVGRVGHRMLASVGGNGTTNGADMISARRETKGERLGRHLSAFPGIAFEKPGRSVVKRGRTPSLRDGMHARAARRLTRRPDRAGSASVGTPDSTSRQEFGVCEIELGDGRVVLQLAGELDVYSAPRVADMLERFSSDGRLCVFDLSRLTFIDSSGLRVLLLAARADAAGGAIPVTGPLPEVVERLLDLLGVGDRVRLEEGS